MSKFAYDTLGTSRELEAAGMERRQAEAVSIAIAQREGNLATKSDIGRVESEIDRVESAISSLRTEVKSDIGRVESAISSLRIEVKSDFSSLRTEVKSDFTEIRLDMKAQFRWVISMQVVVVLAVVGFAFANIS